MSDTLKLAGMAMMAALLALLILSARSCAIDGHHEETKQSRACVESNGKWHPGDFDQVPYCERPEK